MSRYVQILRLLPLLLVLAACSHRIHLIGVADGATLAGTHDLWHRTISVALPNGATVEGPYQPLSTKTVGEGSLFFGANLTELLGAHVSGQFHGYARLTGPDGLVMEIVFALEWTGRGSGVARAGTGEEYRVTL